MFPWIAAVLFGALAPALIVTGFAADIRILPPAFAVTLGHAVVLGLPVALLYRAKHWTRLSAAIAGAFLIGAIPFGIFAWPMSSLRTTASLDGIPTIIHGVPTLAGWFAYLKVLAAFGGLGAVGGFVFWLALRSCGLLTPTDDAENPVASQRPMGLGLAVAAVAASVAVAAIPSTVMDRSCHNMLRDGRWSVSSSLNIDLDIEMDDWPTVTALLENFATSHGMSFRNSSSDRPQVKILGLSACTERVVITAHEQRWASRNYAPLNAGRGVPVGIYDLTEGSAWRPFARELVAVLDSRWPGKVRFISGDGRFIPRSTALPSEQ